jgi:hypothetical protein
MSAQENNSPMDDSTPGLRHLGGAAQLLFGNSGMRLGGFSISAAQHEEELIDAEDDLPMVDDHANSASGEGLATARSPTMSDLNAATPLQDPALPSRVHFLDPENAQLLPLSDPRTDARPQDVCPICLDPMDDLDHAVVIVRCNHMYHRHCLHTWLENPNVAYGTCPMDRQRLFAAPVERVAAQQRRDLEERNRMQALHAEVLRSTYSTLPRAATLAPWPPIETVYTRNGTFILPPRLVMPARSDAVLNDFRDRPSGAGLAAPTPPGSSVHGTAMEAVHARRAQSANVQAGREQERPAASPNPSNIEAAWREASRESRRVLHGNIDDNGEMQHDIQRESNRVSEHQVGTEQTAGVHRGQAARNYGHAARDQQ